MPDYDIYVLDEGEITLSNGAQLDGVTQGNGSHLAGETLTLNSNSWNAIAITDNDDNFQDSDASQQLNGTQVIDGVSYASGTVLEAEYGFVVSDGTNSWTLIGVNVNNSSPAFGTIEGLAFIGGVGDFPPIGVPLTITSTFEGPNFAAADYSTPICFTDGVLVRTDKGEVPVEQIKVGDMVLTRARGYQPVRWVGHRTVIALGSFTPVEIDAGVIGNDRPLVVSQQHRVLLEGWRTQLVSGEDELLVPAVHLVDGHSVRFKPQGRVTYVHFLFDHHEIVQSNGCWSESLLPGVGALKGMVPQSRAEVLALFPELVETDKIASPLCIPQMSRREATAYMQSEASPLHQT